MSEEYREKVAPTDYETRNLDYFCGGATGEERRREYEEHGIIPTNNLTLYIVDDPRPELAPGIPNHHDYRQRSFGPVIERLRSTHPELWEQAKVAIEESVHLLKQYSDLLAGGKQEEAAALENTVDEAVWERRKICDKIFRIIAPELEAAGIDPIEICV